MKTLKNLFIPVALGLVLATGSGAAAMAQTYAAPIAPVIERLEAEGYEVIDTHRSWLGRFVIVSTRDGVLRELVLNRATGAVLSDRLFDLPDATTDPVTPDDADEADQDGNTGASTGQTDGDKGTQGSTGDNGSTGSPG